jgi:hypothetical protein
MKINYANRTIEISKAFANKAQVYGSNEYALLKEVRNDNRGFAVTVVETKKKSAKNSRITLDDMRRYISFHDDANGTIMEEFKARSKKKTDGALTGYNFLELKKWFFETFPEVA